LYAAFDKSKGKPLDDSWTDTTHYMSVMKVNPAGTQHSIGLNEKKMKVIFADESVKFLIFEKKISEGK